MSSLTYQPEIGQWYRRSDKGETFQVTGVDEHANTIEIQTFDGNIDEIEANVWVGLPLEPVEAPEGWIEPNDDEADDIACLRAQAMLENPQLLERLV